MFLMNIASTLIRTETTEKLSRDFNDLKKILMSNISLCHFKKNRYGESIQLDEMIINYLDPLFDKSYARLIQSYCGLKDTKNATRVRDTVL